MANNLSHRLLKRQIRKFLPPNLKDGNELDDFINAINQAYIEFDEDLKRTEHILEESSKELFKANKGLQKIAEEKTKEAEQTAKRLQTVADSISEVIFQMNMDGTWSYLNSAWESITHYSVSESLGTTIFDYVHPLDVEGMQEAFLPISKGEKESCSKTIRFFTKDKEIRWINIKAKLTYNDKKELAGLSGSISDITANYLTQKENEQLALIVQKTKNIMVLTDSNGRITWVNNAFENLTEFALEEIKGKRPGDFLQGENTDLRTIKRIGEHLKSKRSFFGEIINYSKSGREYWLELNIDPYYNDEGEFMGFIAVENEVTDRKQQEEQIIQSEAKLSAVINTIPDSIFYKNAEGKYELVNKAFGELIGQKPEYITGKTDNDLYSTNTAEKIVKDDKELLTAEGIKRTEGEVNKSKGKKILIETTKRTVVDNNGKIKGLVGISRDITEIRNAQQKIIESEERLKITTNSLNIGIFDWDIESNNLIWDESMYRLFEVNEKDFLGAYEAFTKCVITEDLDRVNTEVAHSIETGEKLDTSFKIYSEQGEKYIKATGTVFLNKEGNATRMVGINYDITPEKESEQKLKEYTSNLEKINSELDQFAYVVSHDLKAPLRAINNLSTWIQEDLEDSMDDDIKEQFSLLRGRVLRMEGLINGILEYSRAGRIKSNNQKVNTAQLIVDLCDTLKTHDKIVYEVNEKAPNLFTEKVALEQVFSNLISNAIKYNDKEIAKIKIDFEDQVDFVQFSVKDNGAGISDKYFDKIFVIFQTLQARDQFESTGVGLAIVKKIIEDKGGKIWVESEPKSGATFYFTWPKEQLQPIELN